MSMVLLRFSAQTHYHSQVSQITLVLVPSIARSFLDCSSERRDPLVPRSWMPREFSCIPLASLASCQERYRYF